MPIVLDDVSFAYPDGSLAVEKVSLVIGDGERVAIVGQNGAGKTTMVKMMNGLLRPSSGVVTVDGIPTTSRSAASTAAHVGYVFQNPDDQLFTRSVRSELEYLPRYRKWDDSLRDARVNRAAGLCGIERYMDDNPGDLPLAIRKFVAIAAILVGDCRYVILDEPTSGLDRPGVEMLNRMLDTLEHDGISVVTITHDMRFVVASFHRVVAMAERRVIADGDRAHIFGDDATLRRARIRRLEVAQLARDLELSDNAVELADVVPPIIGAAGATGQRGTMPRKEKS